MYIKIDSYNDILNVQDAKTILRIGTNKMYNLLKTNKIKHFKIGKSIRIPKTSLITYIKEECQSDILEDMI